MSLEGRFALGVSNCRTASAVTESVQRAEELGAEIAFVAEDINCRDSFQLCACAALKTSRIRLAVGVANPYTRNPTALAMSAATLDELSHGRALLGLGSSSPSLIGHQMGIPTGNSVQVMSECVVLVRQLLSGQSVSFAGDRFRYEDARLEMQSVQSVLPIVMAAMGPRMLRLAGRLADIVLLNVGASTEYVRWACGEVARGVREANRPDGAVTIAAWLTVYVTNDYGTTIQRAREWLATVLSVPRQGELLLEKAGVETSILPGIRQQVSAYPHGGNRQAAAAHVSTELAERLVLIGSKSQVARRLREYRAAGVQLPVMSMAAIEKLSATDITG